MGHKKLTTSNPSSNYPESLKKLSTQHITDNQSPHPILIYMGNERGTRQLDELVKTKPVIEIVDNYSEQYAELLLSQHAHLYRANYDIQIASIKEMLQEHYGNRKEWQLGTWVYYPWSRKLVHVLAQKEYEILRTIRNRDLITEHEQEKLYKFNVASFGMSVGSAGAQVISMSGISRNIKLIDGAVVSGSNLNRILTGVDSIGLSKALVIGRQIYEMNPYATVSYFDKATKDNITDILDKPWKIDVVIDEIDDIEMKVRLRYEARQRRIPVIMATELGDTVMLDVERFDKEPNRPLFHGMIPDIEDLIKKPLENYRQWTKHAVQIIDPKNMPLKMQKSVLKIGTNIVTHPQLGSTVMMTGGVLTFAVKSLALNHSLKSGRFIIAFEKEFLSENKTRKYKKEHKQHTKLIKHSINAM